MTERRGDQDTRYCKAGPRDRCSPGSPPSAQLRFARVSRGPGLFPDVVAGLEHLVPELLVVDLEAVDVGAPAGRLLGVMDGVLDLGVRRAVQLGHLGVVHGAIPALRDGGNG